MFFLSLLSLLKSRSVVWLDNSIRKLVIYVFGESDLKRLLEMLLATKGSTWGEPDQVLMEDGIDTSGTGCVRI